MRHGFARGSSKRVSGGLPFPFPMRVFLLEVFEQLRYPRGGVENRLRCDQYEPIHSRSEFVDRTSYPSTENSGREPPDRPIEISPARDLSIGPAPHRPWRVWHLIYPKAKSIEQCPTGHKGRSQLIDIVALPLATGDLVGDETGKRRAEERPTRCN